MDGDGFLSDILLDGRDAEVGGLDDLTIPMTQDTQEVDAQVQPSRSTSKGSKRSKKFHWKEDEVVCVAWLYVSKDPINGANQARDTFWGRVRAYFEEHKETEAVRTESLIMHMWLTIQHQVKSIVTATRRLSVGIRVDKLFKTRYICNLCSISTLNLFFLKRYIH